MQIASGHSWEPIDLAALGEQPAEQPSLGLGHTYPGRVHLHSGEPESAKTLAAYIDCALEMRADRDVVVIDLEMGARLARNLFRSLGVDDFSRLAFIEPIEALTAPGALAIVGPIISTRNPSLIVIDSYSAALELHGCDPNKGPDIQRFHRQVVEPLRAGGAAIVLVDHLVKNRETRGRYSVGSERKLAIVDVHLGFEAVKPLRRGGDGVVKLTTHKDRIGALARPHIGELHLSSAPGTHAITWQLLDVDATDADTNEWKPTVLMAKVSRFLEAQSEPLSKTDVQRGVAGKRAYVIGAIDHLIAEGYATEAPGARGAKLISSLKPFRVPETFPAVPENDSASPVLPFPPPSRGNGNENGSTNTDDAEVQRLLEKYGDDGGAAT